MNRKRLLVVLLILWFVGTMASTIYTFFYVSIYAMAEVFILWFAILFLITLFAPRIRKWTEKQATVGIETGTRQSTHRLFSSVELNTPLGCPLTA